MIWHRSEHPQFFKQNKTKTFSIKHVFSSIIIIKTLICFSFGNPILSSLFNKTPTTTNRFRIFITSAHHGIEKILRRWPGFVFLSFYFEIAFRIAVTTFPFRRWTATIKFNTFYRSYLKHLSRFSKIGKFFTYAGDSLSLSKSTTTLGASSSTPFKLLSCNSSLPSSLSSSTSSTSLKFNLAGKGKKFYFFPSPPPHPFSYN